MLSSGRGDPLRGFWVKKEPEIPWGLSPEQAGAAPLLQPKKKKKKLGKPQRFMVGATEFSAGDKEVQEIIAVSDLEVRK